MSMSTKFRDLLSYPPADDDMYPADEAVFDLDDDPTQPIEIPIDIEPDLPVDVLDRLQPMDVQPIRIGANMLWSVSTMLLHFKDIDFSLLKVCVVRDDGHAYYDPTEALDLFQPRVKPDKSTTKKHTKRGTDPSIQRRLPPAAKWDTPRKGSGSRPASEIIERDGYRYYNAKYLQRLSGLTSQSIAKRARKLAQTNPDAIHYEPFHSKKCVYWRETDIPAEWLPKGW